MFLMTAVLSSIGLIGLFYLLKWIHLQVYNYVVLKRVPGPPRLGILVGNITSLGTTAETVFKGSRQAMREFYPIYRLCALHKARVVIHNHEDCEVIMSNPAHNKKGQPYDLLHNWLKDGLLTSTGSKWQTRRKILTPAFHFSILQQFVQVFNEESDKLIEVLKKECSKSYINIMPHISQFTLKTIAETAMGSKLEFQTKKDTDYKQAVYDIGKILFYRFLHPWFILKWLNIFSPLYFQERKIIKRLHQYTKDVIREREKNFKEIKLPTEEDDIYKGKKRLAMLDLLISAKVKDGMIDDEGIHEEVDTFMFEGHDTTATAITFTLMLLACHKKAQEMIVEEMRDVLGDLHKKPTYNDFQNLNYMERCIKESLRLYPSVYFIIRSLGEDVRTHSGYLLPKDTPVAIQIYDIHRNPEIYPDPEKFDPDRFLPENSKNRHPFAYLPFSAGPRNCIEQRFAMLELKAALCAILASFVLEPIDTPETIVLVVDIVLRTKNHVKIRLIPRDTSQSIFVD